MTAVENAINDRHLKLLSPTHSGIMGAREHVLATEQSLHASTNEAHVIFAHHLPKLLENTVDANRWSRISEAAQGVHPNFGATFVGHLLHVTAAKSTRDFNHALKIAVESTHAPVRATGGNRVLRWLKKATTRGK